MKTITPSPAELERRIARYGALAPMKAQQDPTVPLEAADVVWSRKLMPVIALESESVTPINDQSAPIIGAAGMTMTLAVCPPGQGPTLHAHRKTFETFTVLQGAFEFAFGDKGEHKVVLGRFDTISVPPAICRAFRNVSAEEGILQVIITGGVHDMNDIDIVPEAHSQLERLAPVFLEKLKASGLTFTAGMD
ncbi:MAG: cupin domain-containing protein [Alphaproteobacteria bacterium]|nr:cupin domain-containing protein [Alphaproteobacteria bacterium]